MKRSPVGCAVFACLIGSLAAQTLEQRPEQKPAAVSAARSLANNEATYVKLRNVHVGQEAVRVSNLTLRRDAGTFLLKSGVFYLLEPVNGKITGAVFLGDGEFTLQPPIAIEQRQLAILTKGQPFEERFTSAVFRFTDGSEDEIRKGGAADNSPASGDASGLLADIQQQLRKS